MNFKLIFVAVLAVIAGVSSAKTENKNADAEQGHSNANQNNDN